MTLAEVLKSLFPNGHQVQVSPDGWITGQATLKSGGPISVIGVANGVALGVAGVVPLAKQVLELAAAGGTTPILVLVDTQGQLMARRDEMLGLNEYLGHLAKCLLVASHLGHRTIGLEYGKAAAGAFLATALAADVLIGLPGATPAVMDMPSISRVTKLPESRLQELAKTTAVFAPGLDHMVAVGAVFAVWDAAKPLDAQLEEVLGSTSPDDVRDALGKARKGRPLAADIAKRVITEATAGVHAAA